MYKVKFLYSQFPSSTLFKFFKDKEDADTFIKDLGDRFISVELV